MIFMGGPGPPAPPPPGSALGADPDEIPSYFIVCHSTRLGVASPQRDKVYGKLALLICFWSWICVYMHVLGYYIYEQEQHFTCGSVKSDWRREVRCKGNANRDKRA